MAKKTDWILGVCSNSVGPTYCFSQFTNNRNVYSRYQPQSGYWVIGLHHKHEYRAYEESSTSLLLSMMVPPRRVGVFLDYEAGTVSFYNVTNHGFPIYTFSKYYFPTTLSPYFNPCNCSPNDPASPKLLNILLSPPISEQDPLLIFICISVFPFCTSVFLRSHTLPFKHLFSAKIYPEMIVNIPE